MVLILVFTMCLTSTATFAEETGESTFVLSEVESEEDIAALEEGTSVFGEETVFLEQEPEEVLPMEEPEAETAFQEEPEQMETAFEETEETSEQESLDEPEEKTMPAEAEEDISAETVFPETAESISEETEQEETEDSTHIETEQEEAVVSTYIETEQEEIKDSNIYDETDQKEAELLSESADLLTEETVILMEDGIIASGSLKNNLSWKLTSDNVLVISGSGSMGEFSSSYPCPWKTYRWQINAIVVEEGVTSISDSAFTNCIVCKSVTLPESLTTIGAGAFRYCECLLGLHIPAGVTSIGRNLFGSSESRALERLSVDENNPVYDSRNDCNAIILSADDQLIYGCRNTVIPDTVTSIGELAFSLCRIASITIPSSVMEIGYSAFSNCSYLIDLTLSPGLTLIGSNAFAGCTKLTLVEIPDGVTTLDTAAFSNCSGLKKVVIPKSLKTINSSAFYNCTALSAVCYYGTSSEWYKISIKDNNEPLQNAPRYCDYDPDHTHQYEETIIQESSCTDPGSKSLACSLCGDSYTEEIPAAGHMEVPDPAVPATCTETGLTEGSHCSVCGTVFQRQTVIPAEGHSWDDGMVTTEPTGQETGIMTFTCTKCQASYTEEIPATGILGSGMCGENLRWILDVDGLLVISGTGDMTDDTSDLWDISEVKQVVVEDGATSIGNSAFRSGSAITSVSLPESLTSIGPKAFWGCTSLTEFMIPDHVSSIGNDAFHNCYGIQSIRIPDTVTELSSQLFYNCTQLSDVELPETLTKIGFSAFSGCSALTGIKLPESLVYIAAGAFCDCTNLQDVVIPSGVTALYDGVFYGCTSLEVLELPEGMLKLVDDPFRFCTGLTTLVVPDSINEIGEECFQNCGDGTFIYISGNNSYVVEFLDDHEIPYYVTVPVSEITLPESLVVVKGRTAVLEAAVTPARSVEVDTLTFVTSDDSVATVDSDGIISAVETGECVITASVESGISAQCTIKVLETDPIYIEELYVSPSIETILSGKSYQLRVEYYPSNANTDTEITWSSSDETIAVVDENGIVTGTGTGEGFAVITATTENGISAESQIGVAPPTDYEYPYPYMSDDVQMVINYLKMGGSISCSMNGFYSYLSYNEDTGMLEFHMDNSSRGAHMSFHYDPVALRNADELYFSSSYGDSQSSSGFDTQTITFESASSVPFSGKVMAWTSSTVSNMVDDALTYWQAALVDTLLIGLGNLGFEGYQYVDTHYVPATGLTLNYDSAEIKTGEQLQLTAAFIPENASYQQVEWSSSNPSIASVDENGLVTAHIYGTAVITATAGKGTNSSITASCTVNTKFYDVTGGYYYTPVYWAADLGITKGYSSGAYAGAFGVGLECTRQELMTFLWRFAGKPAVDGDARTMFNDVTKGPNTDANKAIAWGYQNGIVKGYPDGGFHPDAPIVRKDVMIMLYRLAGKPAVSGETTFTDVIQNGYKKTSDTYKAILWGVQKGITKGYSSGELAGQFGCTVNCLREQIVTFLYRYGH